MASDIHSTLLPSRGFLADSPPLQHVHYGIPLEAPCLALAKQRLSRCPGQQSKEEYQRTPLCRRQITSLGTPDDCLRFRAYGLKGS